MLNCHSITLYIINFPEFSSVFWICYLNENNHSSTTMPTQSILFKVKWKLFFITQINTLKHASIYLWANRNMPRDNCCPSHIGRHILLQYACTPIIIMHYMHTNNYHGNKTYINLPNNQHRNAIASFECYKFEYIVSDDIWHELTHLHSEAYMVR